MLTKLSFFAISDDSVNQRQPQWKHGPSSYSQMGQNFEKKSKFLRLNRRPARVIFCGRLRYILTALSPIQSTRLNSTQLNWQFGWVELSCKSVQSSSGALNYTLTTQLNSTENKLNINQFSASRRVLNIFRTGWDELSWVESGALNTLITQLKMLRTTWKKQHANQLGWVETGCYSVQSARQVEFELSFSWVESGTLNWALQIKNNLRANTL